jgi:hypothetical protein
MLAFCCSRLIEGQAQHHPGSRDYAACMDCTGPRQEAHPIFGLSDRRYRPN